MTYLFIFRRDLREYDNSCLNRLAKLGKVIPIFIFTPEQVKSNPYFSSQSFNFLCQSLHSLSKRIPLAVFHGDNRDVIISLIKKYNIQGVGWNKDITPYARKRDLSLKKVCTLQGVQVFEENDYYLSNFEIKFYKKFTPFYNFYQQYKVRAPTTLNIEWKSIQGGVIPKWVENGSFPGTREEALNRLRKASKFVNYESSRNVLHKETTMLSPYLKYNLVSIREAYYKLAHITSLARQLYWRDFYANLMFHLPRSQTLGNSNMRQIKKKWTTNSILVKKWKEGRTGIPLVDAGMRQLNAMGYMHNRARMVVSNFFLVHNLNWRIGEKYFAQKLIDYDVSSNNGNWQWNNGVGADYSGYLRKFNPYLQTKKYDPDCIYVKRWVPELQNIEPKYIHKKGFRYESN